MRILLIAGAVATILGCAQHSSLDYEIVSSWPGDGNASDVIGNNHGALKGGATVSKGNDGTAFEFTRPGDFVEVPNNPSLNIDELQDATFEGWFESHGGSQDGDALIIGKHRCGLAYGWFFTTVQGCFFGNHFIGGQGPNQLNHSAATSSLQLDDGHFHHFACVKSGASYREYVDGKLVSQDKGPKFGTPVDEPLQIGSMNTGTCRPETHQTFGLVGGVKIYSRALSDAEVRKTFALGKKG